ncbi:hypothetical protein [Roseomonas fluvialis]|uniref:Uncharacterized protein n=1 Tax=Roseomonas fluvialis TaxID=1750527 RepID=A0ABN6P444_9PROT|nr:hypothetical protein [Roseomonas fluvialis]BDG73080.1 hypothetical protein Rmf_30090 [Roseomonas fluvialis]
MIPAQAGWRLLVLAAGAGVLALALPLLTWLPGWLRGHGGGVRVALHVALVVGAALLMRRGLVLRRQGASGQAVLALGLLAAVTLPYAALLLAAVFQVGARF